MPGTKDNQHEVMLDIAHVAIQQRAAADGYAQGEYDAQRDPEGYIVSLLNALQQWCLRHGIDWNKELARAQECFEQDVNTNVNEGESTGSPPAIEDLRCPACGHEGSFFIEVTEYLLMFADGVELYGDAGEQWGDWSSCICHSCQHTGTVCQFRATNEAKR